MRFFNYSSPGPFYVDWNYFKEEGLITEDQKWIRITKRGRNEFRPIIALWLGALLSFFFALTFVINYWNSLNGFFVNPLVFALGVGVAPWTIMGFFFLLIYYSVRPGPPTEKC